MVKFSNNISALCPSCLLLSLLESIAMEKRTQPNTLCCGKNVVTEPSVQFGSGRILPLFLISPLSLRKFPTKVKLISVVIKYTTRFSSLKFAFHAVCVFVHIIFGWKLNCHSLAMFRHGLFFMVPRFACCCCCSCPLGTRIFRKGRGEVRPNSMQTDIFGYANFFFQCVCVCVCLVRERERYSERNREKCFWCWIAMVFLGGKKGPCDGDGSSTEITLKKIGILESDI